MKIKLTIPAIALILVLTLIPNDPSAGITHLDKIGHLSIFFLFATAILFDFKTKNVKLKALAAAILLGLSIEIVQPYFGRSFETMDLAFDVLGAALGILLFEMVEPILAKLLPTKTI